MQGNKGSRLDMGYLLRSLRNKFMSVGSPNRSSDSKKEFRAFYDYLCENKGLHWRAVQIDAQSLPQ
jgi:hypothetical protein